MDESSRGRDVRVKYLRLQHFERFYSGHMCCAALGSHGSIGWHDQAKPAQGGARRGGNRDPSHNVCMQFVPGILCRARCHGTPVEQSQLDSSRSSYDKGRMLSSIASCLLNLTWAQKHAGHDVDVNEETTLTREYHAPGRSKGCCNRFSSYGTCRTEISFPPTLGAQGWRQSRCLASQVALRHDESWKSAVLWHVTQAGP